MVLALLALAVTLKENEDAAVLLLEALPKKDFVDVHVFLLLPHHFETHPLWIQVIPVSLQTRLTGRKVQLMRDSLVLFGCTHLIDVGPKEANVFDERVGPVTFFRDFRH